MAPNRDLPIWTRRGLLQHAATCSSIAGLTASFTNAAESDNSVIGPLTRYMSEAATRTLPGEVIEKTKHHTLDTLAAMVSGSGLAPGHVALRLARAHEGEKIATVAASNLLCGPAEAALVNGLLAHSDETDDSHALSHSHPGCATIPAALAAGEQFGIGGAHFLHAVALGYDVGTRVTMALGAFTFQNETHRATHSIASNFCASAAAGCAASLNARQMRWLLDYASQQAAGIAAWQRDTDHIEKGLVFAGFPARNGVTAALLVQAGGTGVEDILSGADNFLLAFSPKADPAQLIDKLGERYEVTRTNIKKWTVGSPIQAVLDCLENIRKRRSFDAGEVKKLVVRLAASNARTVDNREMPDICLQHMLAVMLIDKTASFAAAHDKPRMNDAAVLRQRAKIELIKDEEMERHSERRDAIVEVTLDDGTRLTEHVERVRGTVENPMPREEVVNKCRDLMTPVLGVEKSAKLIEAVLNLESLKSIRLLRPFLQT